MNVVARPRVAFVTTTDTAILHDDFDHPFHVAAFAEAGIELLHLPWEDDTVDWDSFDLVVVRSPWNYVDRFAEFQQWLNGRESMTTLHNPVPLIRWNLDKHYLLDLADRGVAIVPTTYVTTVAALHEALTAIDTPQVIVKPTISAGSRLTGRFVHGSPGAAALGERILASGGTVMVQPFAESVEMAGEIGAVCLGGAISHAFRKGPLLGEEGTLRGGEYCEEITPAPLDDARRDLVLAAQRAALAIARERAWLTAQQQLLYGRYDMVTMADGAPALLEAELFEPSLFLMVDPDAPQRFVATVRALLGR